MADFSGAAILGNSSNMVYDRDQDLWVSAEFQRIAELINEFDPDLYLVFIPERDRDPNSDIKPFAIVHAKPGTEAYPIMSFDESRMNEQLLRDLFLIRRDTANLADILEAQDHAHQIVLSKEWKERRAEAAERAAFMFRTPLHTINMGGGKKVYS